MSTSMAIQFWLDPGHMVLILDIVGMVDEWHKAGVPNQCLYRRLCHFLIVSYGVDCAVVCVVMLVKVSRNLFVISCSVGSYLLFILAISMPLMFSSSSLIALRL